MHGRRPDGCTYCWNIEDMGPSFISDRHIRNGSIYTQERLDEIKRLGADFNVNPEYIEVSFGNECNFKCGYCHPKASSKFWNEIRDHGPYDMVSNHRCDIDWLTLYEEGDNPFVDAWWRWWPTIRSDVNILRITGGEPLLHQSTWRMLEDLERNPLPQLELNLNSNLGVKSVLVERMSTKVRDLLDKGCIRDFQLFTSIDTWGPQAEYIRHGLDLAAWESNLDRYMHICRQPATLMVTFNILSVPGFKGLLEKILEWRKRYAPTDGRVRTIRDLRFDTPYLKEPLQYDINILPKDRFMHFLYDALDFMEANMSDDDKDLFGTLEVAKFKRVVSYMANTEYDEGKIDIGRRDFYRWFKEYDRRRDTNFKSTFPELAEFYDSCRG